MRTASTAHPLWFAAISKSRVRTLLAFTAMVVSGVMQQAAGQSSQVSVSDAGQSAVLNQRQNDVSFTNYKFRDGETLPQLRLHYMTLGNPHKSAAGTVDNGVLLLHWTNASSQALVVTEYREALFAPGAPLDATRFFIIIPDDIGHGRSSKPSDGLRAAFPHYGYGDMVDLQHKLVTESMGIQHLHAIIGMSMGCMNAWQWAEAYPDAIDGIMPVACFPAAISGRNLLWRRMLIDGIRSDPMWENGNYQKQPPSASQGFLLARMMIDGVPALQQEVPTAEAADALIHGVKSQAGGGDANDLLYAFESSRDFNAEPDLSQIKSKVFALNFADDEFYRDSLQILQHDIEQVRRRQVIVRSVSTGSVGHLSMAHPNLWKDQVRAFINWLDTN
jgi:homoserine O-acetyltransferase/O-succinyltransferase